MPVRLIATFAVLLAAGSAGAADDQRCFGDDVEFLQQHVDTQVLGDPAGGPAIAVVGAYQGRVMTSTATGNSGISFGWINYQHIAGGKHSPHINVYGGEERFWLGPEGGQFSIFFAPAARFDLDAWQTPPVIDTAAYQIVSQSAERIHFQHTADLKNYSSTRFKVRIEREIELLDDEMIGESLKLPGKLPAAVAYRTTNRLTNVGPSDWSRETGLLSIWLLGMYKPGPATTVVIPYRQGAETSLGPVVVDDYFGKVPAERLKVAAGVVFFAGDGRYRSKIGIGPRRATALCGSYDAARGVLTIVTYNQPPVSITDYVNSKWELQSEPFAGDVINAYNDGPPEPGGTPLGPFYELETSSPALALKRGETGSHIQTTVHFVGDTDNLNRLATKLLGVSLAQITSALR